MESPFFYNKKIGILGGGQLGKMLCIAAADWHLQTLVLDPTPGCPASLVCNQVQTGSFTDFDTVYRFGLGVDIITIEIDSVNADALIRLAEEGKTVYPDPHKLKIIQDKGLQKEFFVKNNLKSPAYFLCDNKEQVYDLIRKSKIRVPFVQKLRKAGYDGRGVVIINKAADLALLMDAPCVVEQKISIKKELSVIAVQDVKGNVKCFTTVEMIFEERANLVKYLLCPAQISNEVSVKALELAAKTIKAFEIVGLLAVELFLDEHDELLINEVSPRPHNSGHHTIESAHTSQYEQHLRAILGLPLGSVEMLMPAVMLNILGEPGYSGFVRYEGLNKCLGAEGAKVHIYGKQETRPFRKMGHVTVVDNCLENAKKTAEHIDSFLKAIT